MLLGILSVGDKSYIVFVVAALQFMIGTLRSGLNTRVLDFAFDE